jgi:hypothetical protein
MDAVIGSMSRSALAALLVAGLLPSLAVARQSATLSVGARVAPACAIHVDAPTISDANRAGVRVQCGRSGLRVLRATTDRGDGLQPVVTFAGKQLRAGGEVTVVVAQPLATVASRLPVLAAPPQPDRRPVLVTLDF